MKVNHESALIKPNGFPIIFPPFLKGREAVEGQSTLFLTIPATATYEPHNQPPEASKTNNG